MKISRDHKKTTIISFTKGIHRESFLKRFNMKDCEPEETPIFENHELNDDNSPKIEKAKEQVKHVPYANSIGCLMHAMMSIGPDISFVIGLLSRAGHY